LAKRSPRQSRTRLTASRRQRYLSDSELKLFLAWSPKSAFSRNHRLALTLQTGCRSGEAIAAERSDFDLEAGIWHQPESKTGIPRDLKLPRQTVKRLLAAGVRPLPVPRRCALPPVPHSLGFLARGGVAGPGVSQIGTIASRDSDAIIF